MLTNPPLWTQNGKYTAEHDRRLIGGLVRSEGVADSLSMRTTVVNNSRQVSIGAGGAYIKGDYSQNGGSGMYFAYNDGAHQVAIPVAGTQPRYDLIILRVYDSAVSGSVNEVRFQVIQGTAASSPRIPSVPLSSIAIAAVKVNPGATHLQASNISDQRTVAQFNGGITGNVASTQQTKLNQVASPNNPVLITKSGDPNTLYLGTGSGFNPIGASIIVNRVTDLPKSAPEGTMATSGQDGRTYQMRGGSWKFFAGWGPHVSIGRHEDHKSHVGPYIGGLSLNAGSNAFGSERPYSSSDYSTYFAITSGSTGDTLSRAGGVTFKRAGMFHVEFRYQVFGLRNGTGVRSRISGPGISQFSTMDNGEQYELVNKGQERSFSGSSTVSVTSTQGVSTYGKIVPWVRTSAPVIMSTTLLKVEMMYEF